MNSKSRMSPVRPGSRLRRWFGESGTRRGVAILLVIAVLAGMVALAAPFVMSMVLHGRQARNDVTSLQARSGAEAAIAHATAQLYKTTLRDEQAQQNGEPFVTTPADLKVSMEFPAVQARLEALGVNVQNTGGLMWHAKVEDEQGKINISTAHPIVLGNVMGSAILTESVPAGANTLSVDDASAFRPEFGTISLSGEPAPIQYRLAKGNTIILVGAVTRGHQEGALVYDGRAQMIADYKVRGANEGDYRPLKSIYEIKAALVNESMGPDEFARMERHITVQSGLGGPLWGNTQIPPQPAANAEITGLNVERGDGFSAGGLIRLVMNGKVICYRRLAGVSLRGDGSAALSWVEPFRVPEAKNPLDIIILQPEFQHPVNINTASTEVLEAVFTGLCMFGSKDAINREKAALLVDHLRERGTIYSTRDQLKKALDEAHNRGLLTISQRDAVYINAVEPNSPKLRTATVPFVFHSFGHFTIEGSGVVNSENGVQLSRNTQRQLLSLPTPWPGHFRVEYQRQFQQLLDKGLGARVVTFPEPMGDRRYKRNIGTVRLGREDSGGVRLDVGETGPMGLPGEWLEHCSDPNDAAFRQDGYDMGKRGPWDIDKDAPSNGGASTSGNRRVIVARTGRPNNPRRNTGSSIGDVATQPGVVEMWYKPIGGGQGVFYDESLEEDRNRLTFSYQPGKGLVVEVCDAGYECQSLRTGFNHLQRNPIQYIYPVNLTPGDWHHVAASWKAGGFNGIEIRYDAQFVPPTGDAIIQKPGSKLARSLGLTDDVVELEEAPDEDFPARGAIRVGEEIIEYHQKAGNALTQCKRGARMSAIARHDEGEMVFPHGYSVPIAHDWFVGGAKLAEHVPAYQDTLGVRVEIPPTKNPPFVVDSDSTEIPVNNASSLPPTGFVTIGGELIYYGKRTATKLQQLQRGMRTRNHAPPRRNLYNGNDVRLASIEITNSIDYDEDGIVQLDDETNDKQVEWLSYSSKQIINGKHYLVATMNSGNGDIQVGNPAVTQRGALYIGPHRTNHTNFRRGRQYQRDFRGCFDVGVGYAHAKKTNVIPVMRVTRPDCGDRDSAFGERGVSEISVVERGSTSGDLMFIKQAVIYQEPVYDEIWNASHTQIVDEVFRDWNIQYYVGLNDFLSRRYPAVNTRVLKWPSGELPDAVNAKRMIGANRNGEGQLRGHVDEIRFNQLNTETARIAMTTTGLGISADEQSILLEDRDSFPQDFAPHPPRGTRASNINWPPQGLIRIEDEIMYYEGFQAGTSFNYYSDQWPRLDQAQQPTQSKAERIFPNRFRGDEHKPNICQATGFTITRLKRGLFGTEAKDHPAGATVMLMDGVAVSPLTTAITGRADSVTLRNGAGFPTEGYIWVNKEVISYLDGGGKGNNSSVTLTGIRNFRARFGTSEDSHEAGDLALALPFRYWDRNPQYQESDGIAFVQGGYHAQDAIWDSVELITKGTDEYPKPNAVRPRIHVRFDGKPSWSAEPSNVDGGLWEFRNRDGMIPLRLETGTGVRAEEVEMRVYWEYKPGAFIPNADWKRTFQIERMRVNYRTPLIIRRLDELERR